ncbi:MAG TPA: hypothetical protein VEZ59_11285, partial [Sphingopyxis sp.]|nr:hypothetical protein [Sphingopyxis sp.]
MDEYAKSVAGKVRRDPMLRRDIARFLFPQPSDWATGLKQSLPGMVNRTRPVTARGQPLVACVQPWKWRMLS